LAGREVGEASWLCFFGRGQSEDASPPHRNPLGRSQLAVFPSGQLRHFQEVTPEEHAKGVIDLRSPGWSAAEPWVLNISMRPRSDRAPEDSERVSLNVGMSPGAPLKQLWFCQKRKNLADQSPRLPPIDNAMIETERQFGLQAWLEPA